jgi:hypothetical protein
MGLELTLIAWALFNLAFGVWNFYAINRVSKASIALSFMLHKADRGGFEEWEASLDGYAAELAEGMGLDDAAREVMEWSDLMDSAEAAALRDALGTHLTR